MHDRLNYIDSFNWEDEYQEWTRAHKPSWWHRNNMGLWTWVGVGVVSALIVALLIRCCCRQRNGRVLAPPPHNTTVTVPAPYPQQQFAPAHYPAPIGVQVVGPAYPAPVAYPTNMPTNYPTAGGYYPAETPYPTGGYPMPQPAPTAPDVHAGPPSYSQVMGEKQPPYNPSAPH